MLTQRLPALCLAAGLLCTGGIMAAESTPTDPVEPTPPNHGPPGTPRRIVAFGDSITAGVRRGVTEGQTFRSLLTDQLRRQGLAVDLLNAGVGGNTSAHALQRLDRDVLAARPDLVIVMFGMNDAAMVDGGPVARTAPRVPLEQYVANLRTIVTRCRENGAKVLLCAPTPMTRQYPYQHLGEYARHDDMNYMLRRYAEAVRSLGAELGAPTVDGFALFADHPETLALITDGCHPYAQGHARLAEALLAPVLALLSTP